MSTDKGDGGLGGIIDTKGRRVSAPKRSVSLIALGAAAVVFLAILIALQLFSDASAPLPQPESTGPGRVTGIMIALTPLLTAWGVSIFLRCSDAKIRGCLMTIVGLLLSWFLLVLLKYPSPDDLFVSACWYLFYIPMVFIPTLALLAGIRAAALDAKRPWKQVRGIVVLISSLLVLFVLTNNLHHGAFAFDFADPGWSSNYTYGPVYWMVLLWVIIQLLCFYALMFVAAQKQMRSVLLPLIIIGCLGVLYSLFYILKVEAVFRSNLALVYLLLTLVFVELGLDFGIFPSFMRYRKAFESLPYDVKVLTPHMEVAFSTDAAAPLGQETVDALKSSGFCEAALHEETVTRFVLPDAPGLVFKRYHVPGAQVLLIEDISALENLRTELIAKQDMLVKQNMFLEQQQKLAREAHRLTSERMLYQQLETALSATLEELSLVMDSLVHQHKTMSAHERQHKLRRAGLLVAQCKRKGALLLAAGDEPWLTQEELNVFATEAAADIRSSGISCAVTLGAKQPIARHTFSQFYDCLFTVALQALTLACPSLLAAVDHEEQGIPILRIALGAEKHAAEELRRLALLLSQTYGCQGLTCDAHTSDEQLNLRICAGAG